MMERSTRFAGVSSLLALFLPAGCTATRIDKLPLFYYESSSEHDYRLDIAHSVHWERQPDYSSMRLFPLISRTHYQPAIGTAARIHEQFGIETILPIWHREADENRYRVRVLPLFGFDYLSIVRLDQRGEDLDEGGRRSNSDFTFLPYVGDGLAFFRVRSSELTGTNDAEQTTSVDVLRMFWDEGLEFITYRSRTPATAPTSPPSRTLDVGRMIFGNVILFREHVIEGVETEWRTLGFFETDPIAQSLFRWRVRKEPDGASTTSILQAIGPLFLYEDRTTGSKLRIAPLFTLDREGDQRTLYLFQLIPIPLWAGAAP